MSAEFDCLLRGASANHLKVAELSEFVKDRLYFMVLCNHKNSKQLQSLKEWKTSLKDNNLFYLNVDNLLVYDGFYNDFGPLNLAMIYRYVSIVKDKFKIHKRVVHCAYKIDHKKRANAAFLICAYMIIEENWTAKQAYTILSQQYKHKYISFRDASCLLNSEYSVTVEECVNALYKAKWYRFFDFSDFDLDEYEKYETVKFGDINWIVPSTMLAFSSPHSHDYVDKSGYQIHSPAYYYQYFQENNVKHVIRLNSKRTYDAQGTFVAVAHINHTDMIFADGTPPTDTILNYFLELCEQYIDDCPEVNGSNAIDTNTNVNNKDVDKLNKYGGAVAVHCKAGLGRTGCLIASYIVKHWAFTAVEAIAWIRICRPGSVIGAQQKWLIEREEYLKITGKQWRERKNQTDKYKRFKNGVYSVKRHTNNTTSFEYIDPPPQLCFSDQGMLLINTSSSGEVECLQSKQCIQSRLSTVLKKKLKTNNHVLSNNERDVHVPNLRQKRSASKNEDKLKLLPAVKSCRKSNTSTEMNVNNNTKINSPLSTEVTKNNSKACKKNIKAISLNKTNSRLTRLSTALETTSKVAVESKPSYTRATVSSSARTSRRLRCQNCTNK